jgi:hypothetical protein
MLSGKKSKAMLLETGREIDWMTKEQKKKSLRTPMLK